MLLAFITKRVGQAYRQTNYNNNYKFLPLGHIFFTWHPIITRPPYNQYLNYICMVLIRWFNSVSEGSELWRKVGQSCSNALDVLISCPHCFFPHNIFSLISFFNSHASSFRVHFRVCTLSVYLPLYDRSSVYCSKFWQDSWSK